VRLSAAIRAIAVRCLISPAGGRTFPTGKIILSFTHRYAQCTRCVLQLTFNRSPTAWLQSSDGRTNCRVYRSLNGIVEAGTAIEAMPDAARILRFPGRHHQIGMDRRTGVSQ
jgi:hypothetical protein